MDIYPLNSIFSILSREYISNTTNEQLLMALRNDYQDVVHNNVPDSIRVLKAKLIEIMGGEPEIEGTKILEKFHIQQCSHFIHTMNLKSKQWGQSKGWWHTPFVLDEKKPLNTIESYRHNPVIYNDLLWCKKMLNKRIGLLNIMYLIERNIMNFLVYIPRTMYNFYDNKIRMYSGQYEASIIIYHLIIQLNWDNTKTKFNLNGTDEFCRKALMNEAIKNAKYFIKESEDFDSYHIELPNINYRIFFDHQHKFYDDKFLTEKVLTYYNYKLKLEPSIIPNIIDTVIFIWVSSRGRPLFNGSDEEFFAAIKNYPHVRYAAICFIVNIEMNNIKFTTKKTGGNNKKIHVIKELNKISKLIMASNSFEKKQHLLYEFDYSLTGFIAYYCSAFINTMEYDSPPNEGLKEYLSVRKHKWRLIEMLYSTLIDIPNERLQHLLNILNEQLNKWLASSEKMNIAKLSAQTLYNEMKANGEWDKL